MIPKPEHNLHHTRPYKMSVVLHATWSLSAPPTLPQPRAVVHYPMTAARKMQCIAHKAHPWPYLCGWDGLGDISPTERGCRFAQQPPPHLLPADPQCLCRPSVLLKEQLVNLNVM